MNVARTWVTLMPSSPETRMIQCCWISTAVTATSASTFLFIGYFCKSFDCWPSTKQKKTTHSCHGHTSRATIVKKRGTTSKNGSHCNWPWNDFSVTTTSQFVWQCTCWRNSKHGNVQATVTKFTAVYMSAQQSARQCTFQRNKVHGSAHTGAILCT